MKLSQTQQTVLLTATAKALATSATDVNVVPVSSVKIVNNEIWLINYFFEKTVDNIIQNPKVALTFWSGLVGYQVKAKAEYVTQGVDFDKATAWIAEVHPNRLVKGLVKLQPCEIFDISIANKCI